MTRQIRPSEPADAPGIRNVLAAAGLEPNIESAALHWKYWQPRTDFSEPRSYVMVRDGAIVAHTGVVPGSSTWAGRHMKILHAIDWAALPGEMGAGGALMKHIGRACDALLAIGGSEQSLKIFPYLGFRAFGVATGYVRPLRPLHLWQLAAASPARRAARIARGLAWQLSAPHCAAMGWRAERVKAGELESLCRLLPSAFEHYAVMERSTAAFAYHLQCPIAPMQLWRLEHKGQLCGYFLLTCAPGQARLADAWVRANDAAGWEALLACAVRAARERTDCAELVAWGNDPLLTQALEAGGFHSRGTTAVHIRPGESGLLPEALRVQMIDCDLAYLHSGRPELWA